MTTILSAEIEVIINRSTRCDISEDFSDDDCHLVVFLSFYTNTGSD
jgi:hypothetical protein